MPEPLTPTTDPVVETPVDPAVEESAVANDKEWDDAIKDMYPSLIEEKKEEEKEVEKPTEPVKPTDPAAPVDPAKPADPVDGDKDEETPPAEIPAPLSVAEARETQAAIAQEFDAVKRDVAVELFKDIPLELKDQDGDPIRTVEDVMKLGYPVKDENGKTVLKPFTEQEAIAWLALEQNKLRENLEKADQEANRITNINISLKDQADKVQREFGEVLKANPDVFKEIWAEYQKTLKVSPNGKVVTEAPVSLYSFAKTALSPYTKVAQAESEAAAARDAAEKAKRSQARVSRSDIFGSGKTENLTKEEKEWAEAVAGYFGNN